MMYCTLKKAIILIKYEKVKHAIYDNLLQYGYDKDKIYKEVADIFSIMERQQEYDQYNGVDWWY